MLLNSLQHTRFFILSVLLVCSLTTLAFTVLPSSSFTRQRSNIQHDESIHNSNLLLAGDDNVEGVGSDDDDQFSLSSLFQAAEAKGVSVSADDLEDYDEEEEDEEDDDEEDEEEEPNIPQGAINAFLGYDTGITTDDDAMAGNVSLTNDQLYSEVKERVLDTAGGFVDFVKGASEEDDLLDEYDDDDDDTPKPYQTPEIVPDSDLTAGEVVLTVLEALKNNDNPYDNRGVEVFFGYSSSGSQVKNEVGLTPKEYAEFWKETEYNVLFHQEEVMIDKGQYSFNGKKAFFTARLRVSDDAASQAEQSSFSSRRRKSPAAEKLSKNNNNNWISVNFILSVERKTSTGDGTVSITDDNDADADDDNNCWMIDSLLIRPQSMQRRRR